MRGLGETENLSQCLYSAVDAFFFCYEGTAEDEGMDGADVFADDAEGDELDGAKEEQAKYNGSDADGEIVPENELVNQVKHTGDEAEEGADEPDEDDEAEGHLGEVGDAQHREVVERVKVLARDAARSPVLVVFDSGYGKAQFSDDSAEIGVRIAKISSNSVDDRAIVEAESGEVLEDADVGEPRDKAVIRGANTVHQAIFIAGFLDCSDDGGSVFPGADHVNEELRWVLEVGHKNSDGVALGLKKGVHAGAVGSDVAGIDDDLDGGVFGGHLAQDCNRVVSGGVVDEEVLEAIQRECCANCHEATMDLADVELLVVAGGHDGDRLAACSDAVQNSGLRIQAFDQLSRHGSIEGKSSIGVEADCIQPQTTVIRVDARSVRR